jgi:hypothetical protein
MIKIRTPSSYSYLGSIIMCEHDYEYNIFIHSFTGAYSPGWTFGLAFLSFLITHIQIHGRTPLDEWNIIHNHI